ncbi:GNAT family N-acetyltransferase [Tundrisphaera lichenicola]|uniref:GNAT family N-acetyltransferase n=1 Tax=Tundrisphaera lichenicola TaxID=2029860 RepID=UPI003EB7CEBC
MIRIRAFRNGDPPALADLWNRALPDQIVVRPLTAHEFDTLILGRVGFDREGLIIAEHVDGQIIGFAHAGFGPESPTGSPQRRDYELGSIAMLAIDPEHEGSDLARDLILAGETYLRGRGARVLYAGGQFPLNPFYWGVYGGSEFSGVLESHRAFRLAATGADYEPASTTILLDLDLSRSEIRDPRSAILRRQSRIEVVDDPIPSGWWEAEAIGNSQVSRFRLLSKDDDREIAHASAWDMAAFGRSDGRARTGIFDFEVTPNDRRKGYGRYLLVEILRYIKNQWGEVASVQTSATNEPALKLYRSMGFEQVETSILYRKAGGVDH